MINPPYMREVLVTTDYESWFPAMLANVDSESVVFAATTDDHPICWCDGYCWNSNSHGEGSAKVLSWREL